MTNEASALVDTDAANRAADADLALQELGADYAGQAYVTATIAVWDKGDTEGKDLHRDPVTAPATNGRGRHAPAPHTSSKYDFIVKGRRDRRCA